MSRLYCKKSTLVNKISHLTKVASRGSYEKLKRIVKIFSQLVDCGTTLAYFLANTLVICLGLQMFSKDFSHGLDLATHVFDSGLGSVPLLAPLFWNEIFFSY